MTKKKIKERQQFLDVHQEFYNALSAMGFRMGHYWKESSTYLDVTYEWQRKYIPDSLFGVEHLILDSLNFSIRFLRDFNEHKIMFIGDMYTHSEVYSLAEGMKYIKQEVIALRDKKLSEMALLANIN